MVWFVGTKVVHLNVIRCIIPFLYGLYLYLVSEVLSYLEAIKIFSYIFSKSHTIVLLHIVF